MTSNVDLGIASNDFDPKELESPFFPSKIGGKPAWLQLENLPTPEELSCKNCDKQLAFLLQLYSPIDGQDDAFHRTFFVFICKEKTCSERSIMVFRNQLPRKNKFYSFNPPDENTTLDIKQFVELCDNCGCLGPKKCSKCKQVNYCSKEHQLIDWKLKHKKDCLNASMTDTDICPPNLWPTKSIIIESESILNEFNDLDLEQKIPETDVEITEQDEKEIKDLIKQANKNALDKTFLKFRKRIETEPYQIIRYERNGLPLYLSDNIPAAIPNCEYCGAERHFEFQIMPQILWDLKENDVDFGTLIVYTCSKFCGNNDAYKKEFVFLQNVNNME